MKLSKRFIAMLLITAITTAIAGCGGKPAEHERMDTPVRIGTEGRWHASLNISYETWGEVLENYEFIADITITEWLGEITTRNNDVTVFSAYVNNVFKGELPDEIKISQVGSGKWTYDKYPLFQNGNRMLIFMNKTKGTSVNFHIERYIELCEFEGIEYNVEHVNFIEHLLEDIYIASGGFELFLFDIEEYNEETFLISRSGGSILYFLNGGDSEMEALDSEEELVINIIQQLYENDPLLENNTWQVKDVFEYIDFTDEIIEITRRQNNNDQGDDDDQGGGNENDQGGNDQGGGNRRPQGGNEQ